MYYKYIYMDVYREMGLFQAIFRLYLYDKNPQS